MILLLLLAVTASPAAAQAPPTRGYDARLTQYPYPFPVQMLAVEAPYEQALEWMAGRAADVSIAAVNGPLSVVVSGKAGAVDEVA